MLDIETFLITVYVLADAFCQTRKEAIRPGPSPSLSRTEVLTLSVFGQWVRFSSERGFYRFARQCLHPLFPHLCDRSQYNRLTRRYREDTAAFALYLADQLGAPESLYEVVDRCGLPTRDRRRRGDGWLRLYTDIGLSNRIGFFEGLQLLDCVTENGVVTGFVVGSASAKDQSMAEAFFALRCHPHPRFACVGHSAGNVYLADKGFSGPKTHQRWKESYGASLSCPPQRNHGTPWPKDWRIWLSGHRQIIETVHEKLLNTFRLGTERPHSFDGFLTRLSAKMALHNLCILINRQLGRNPLAFADLLGWS